MIDKKWIRFGVIALIAAGALTGCSKKQEPVVIVQPPAAAIEDQNQSHKPKPWTPDYSFTPIDPKMNNEGNVTTEKSNKPAVD